MKKNDKKQMSPSERLQGMEMAIATVDQALYNMTRQIATLTEAVSLLNEKLSSLMVASQTGQPLTDQIIDEISMARKEEELKKKIQNLLDKGSVSPSTEISETSVVVARQMNKSGEVENRRWQFVVSSLDKDTQGLMLGKKVGDFVEFKNSPDSYLEIQEIYDIVLNKPTETATEQEEAQA